MQTVRGHLTQVQEQRFRIATRGGPNYLLTVAHNVPLDESDLRGLLDEVAEVVVDYAGDPGLSTGIAHRIRRA